VVPSYSAASQTVEVLFWFISLFVGRFLCGRAYFAWSECFEDRAEIVWSRTLLEKPVVDRLWLQFPCDVRNPKVQYSNMKQHGAKSPLGALRSVSGEWIQLAQYGIIMLLCAYEPSDVWK
jgi:hypothetical protein